MGIKGFFKKLREDNERSYEEEASSEPVESTENIEEVESVDSCESVDKKPTEESEAGAHVGPVPSKDEVCAREEDLEKLHADLDEAYDYIEKLKEALLYYQNAYKEARKYKDLLLNEQKRRERAEARIGFERKTEASDIHSALHNAQEDLTTLMKHVNATKEELSRYKQKAEELKKDTAEAEEALLSLEIQLEAAAKERAALEEELQELCTESLTRSIDLTPFEKLNSEECKSRLNLLALKAAQMIKDGSAFVVLEKNISAKVLTDQKKQIIRCFNAECRTLLDALTARNVDTCRSKITRSYDSLNKMFAVDRIAISLAYYEIKLQEIDAVYAYRLKKEQENEERKAIREQMLEEEKVRREIEREKLHIQKEESHFRNEISKLLDYMSRATDEIQSQLYAEKIRDAEARLAELEKAKRSVDELEGNTRAGFVYIISNIGSFGDGVYKIGMTRRIEPMDRISELSSASVPFKFDVHAMIFSHDAPALEAALHNAFRDKQVNAVNSRKEFFRVDLEDIRRVVHENHNATVDFFMEAPAEEYMETMRERSAEKS